MAMPNLFLISKRVCINNYNTTPTWHKHCVLLQDLKPIPSKNNVLTFKIFTATVYYELSV